MISVSISHSTITDTSKNKIKEGIASERNWQRSNLHYMCECVFIKVLLHLFHGNRLGLKPNQLWSKCLEELVRGFSRSICWFASRIIGCWLIFYIKIDWFPLTWRTQPPLKSMSLCVHLFQKSPSSPVCFSIVPSANRLDWLTYCYFEWRH